MDEQLRVVSFNLNGAFHNQRSTHGQQARAWQHLADIALVQETGRNAVPVWVDDHWDVVRGEIGRHGKGYGWESAIAARPDLNLVPRDDLVEQDPWPALLYDHLVASTVDGHEPLPGTTR